MWCGKTSVKTRWKKVWMRSFSLEKGQSKSTAGFFVHFFKVCILSYSLGFMKVFYILQFPPVRLSVSNISETSKLDFFEFLHNANGIQSSKNERFFKKIIPYLGKSGQKWTQKGLSFFYDKNCHLIFWKTVESEKYYLFYSSDFTSGKILVYKLLPKVLSSNLSTISQERL